MVADALTKALPLPKGQAFHEGAQACISLRGSVGFAPANYSEPLCLPNIVCSPIYFISYILFICYPHVLHLLDTPIPHHFHTYILCIHQTPLSCLPTETLR